MYDIEFYVQTDVFDIGDNNNDNNLGWIEGSKPGSRLKGSHMCTL